MSDPWYTYCWHPDAKKLWAALPPELSSFCKSDPKEHKPTKRAAFCLNTLCTGCWARLILAVAYFRCPSIPIDRASWLSTLTWMVGNGLLKTPIIVRTL